jgi:HK97 family phage prohead protease
MEQRLSPAYECKFAAASAVGEFTGYASTFGGPPDAYGDIVAPGAFAKSLAAHRSDGTTPALLWSHDPSEPIGKWLSITEDRHGLAVTGKLTLGTHRGAEAYALLKDDALAMSIGYQTRNRETTKEGRTLLEVDLHETSLVAMPANTRARVTSVKSFRPGDPRTLEAALRDELGYSLREAKRLVSGGWRALSDDDSEELQSVAALIRGAAHSFS